MWTVSVAFCCHLQNHLLIILSFWYLFRCAKLQEVTVLTYFKQAIIYAKSPNLSQVVILFFCSVLFFFPAATALIRTLQNPFMEWISVFCASRRQLLALTQPLDVRQLRCHVSRWLWPPDDHVDLPAWTQCSPNTGQHHPSWRSSCWWRSLLLFPTHCWRFQSGLPCFLSYCFLAYASGPDHHMRSCYQPKEDLACVNFLLKDQQSTISKLGED